MLIDYTMGMHNGLGAGQKVRFWQRGCIGTSALTPHRFCNCCTHCLLQLQLTTKIATVVSALTSGITTVAHCAQLKTQQPAAPKPLALALPAKRLMTKLL